MNIKNYTIDGKFGRVELNILEQQKGKDTTHNWMVLDEDSRYVDKGEEFVEGLPDDLSFDDYFKMALLGAIRGSKNATYKNGNEIKDLNNNMKEIVSQLSTINNNINSLNKSIILANGGTIK